MCIMLMLMVHIAQIRMGVTLTLRREIQMIIKLKNPARKSKKIRLPPRSPTAAQL